MLSFIIVLSLTISSSIAGKYKKGDPVTVYVNKVGPYYNPHETYHYYELPVCRPEKVEHKSLTLGEILDGDRMAVSLYKLKFLEKSTEQVLCKLHLSATDVERLVHAIEELFFFEFVIDDLPVRGFVGKFEEEGVFPHRHQTYLYTKHKIEIEYNGDHIIFARIKPYDPVLLHEQLQELTVDFHFSVEWIASSIPFESREKRLKELSLFPRALEIHWISIVNSAVLVVLLIGFISIILANILKKDFARYNVEEGGAVVGDEDLLRADEYGWKIIYGDVFRPPKYKTFFCAVIGCGCQLLAIATSVLVMAMFGMFNVHQHGRLNASLVLLYAFTSWIAGIVSAHFYRQFNGVSWVANINITSALFTGPVFIIWAMVNTTAWILGTTQALPWTTVLLFLVLFTCVGYPLTILGGIMGKNLTRPFEAPVRTKQIPREIPQLAFYKSPFFTAIVGGFLPFSSISVELYYLFATWWGREPYTLYGVLSLMYVILLSVSACIAVALLYFQLAAEDYRWWWRALGNTGSTGVYILLYALFYYVRRSQMSGVLQLVEYIGYTLLFAYALSLMLAAIGFIAAFRFVTYIYSNIKLD